jgi:hypothetical protein
MYGWAALDPEPISVTAPAAGASTRAGNATIAPTRIPLAFERFSGARFAAGPLFHARVKALLIDLNGVPFAFRAGAVPGRGIGYAARTPEF